MEGYDHLLWLLFAVKVSKSSHTLFHSGWSWWSFWNNNWNNDHSYPSWIHMMMTGLQTDCWKVNQGTFFYSSRLQQDTLFMQIRMISRMMRFRIVGRCLLPILLNILKPQTELVKRRCETAHRRKFLLFLVLWFLFTTLIDSVLSPEARVH